MNKISISFRAFAAAVGFMLTGLSGFAQESARPQTTPAGFRIGERLTYTISFQRNENAGFIETYVVSRGKLGDTDAVELRMRIKTTGFFSAAFYQIDESRTTFASPDTGNPLFVRRLDNSGVSGRETTSNYVSTPAPGLDLLTLIYKARQSAGIGSFILADGDRSYSITLQPLNGEHLKTDAGDFDTTITNIQCDYLTENGIQNLRVNFSNDDAHIPVQARFKTTRGEVRITLSGIQTTEPEIDTAPTPTPAPTPNPVQTPRPSPTPTPYIVNQPLSTDLGFQLGESLRYQISNGDRKIAELIVQPKERRLVNKEDSLLLSATVTAAEAGNGYFNAGDSILAQVSPETLFPYEISIKFSGSLASLDHNATFDQKTGTITTDQQRIDAPVGTHCILSLFYAVRSFNLVPSKNASSPVNDTRVAVFWEGKPHIFTLRPFEPETITVAGKKVVAQKITVITGIPQLDQLGLKFWLSTDEARLPIMISLGQFKAELLDRR